MIKFFRKIRQNLLMENKTGKYFKYAIGEIVLVVIGILIALQINNWNENRKTENIKQDYYYQILEDLKKDLKFSKATIEEFENNKILFQNYYQIYDKQELDLPEIFTAINKLVIATKPLSFNSSTIETLQNSGDIKLIPTSIRNKLIDLRRNQLHIIKRAEFLDKGKNEVIQKTSLLTGSDSLQEKLKNHDNLRKQLGRNINLSDVILSIEGAHDWKNILENEVSLKLLQMEKDIMEIIELIKDEAEK
jgi:uncharacterized membrane protein YgaE (UPF0421/DUF939 family)